MADAGGGDETAEGEAGARGEACGDGRGGCGSEGEERGIRGKAGWGWRKLVGAIADARVS